jgi:hypothetical protein
VIKEKIETKNLLVGRFRVCEDLNPTHEEVCGMNVIVAERHRTKEKILDAAMLPIRELLPTALIEGWCVAAGHTWRERVMGPVVTILASVWKHMQPKVVSARDVEDGVAELSAREKPSGSRSGSDFCHARMRLPLIVFEQALEHVGNVAMRSSGALWKGLYLWLMDGSSVRTPNTLPLEQRYGRSTNGTHDSKHPVVRLLALVCAGSGAVLRLLTAPYIVSEPALFIRLLENLAPGGLLVADRIFSSFLLCSLVTRRGSHLLVRLRADRLGLGEKVRRLGHRDNLVEWKRPKPSYSARPDLLATCPGRLQVRVLERIVQRRGYRSWTLLLVTTLTDPVAYPAAELVEIYLRRWQIETAFRTLKTDYGMARVAGQTPDVVEKEIRSTVLAYNCVAALMSASGEAPELLSPTRAKNIVMRFANYMSHAATIQLLPLYRRMLRLLATALQMPQERDPQPRAVLRNRSDYPLLNGTRERWRRKLLVA